MILAFLPNPWRWFTVGSVVGWLFAASALAVDVPTTQLLPVVPGTEAERSTPFIAWFEDLSESGYVEEEYLVSGDANIYEYVEASGPSAQVRVRDAAIPYTSRLLIRRPERPERFNGTVYLEVLNPTAGWDGDPIWQNTHDYMMREGAVYVGLTSKPVALHFLRDKWGNGADFPVRNNTRYAGLAMPRFGQIWDMLSETAALLKAPDKAANPLIGFAVQRIILVGYSQSVAYQITYANSFHERDRMPDGRPLMDGYYLAAGGSAKNIRRVSQETESLSRDDERNLLRVNAPVVRFQTETEVPNSHRWRQQPPEYPLVRTYEMAGGAHVDQATADVGGVALARDLGLPGYGAGCEAVINPVRIGFVQSAMLAITDQWVRGSAQPPASRVISVITDADGSTVIERDDDGNAVGGIRPPRLDVPLGQYLPNNTGQGFCRLIGSFHPFADAELSVRYPDRIDYFERVAAAAVRAVADRFLLEPDAQQTLTEAAQWAVGR